MAWTPISNTVPQYEEDGIAASGFYIKFYEAGTTTPTAMATDSTGGTLLDKCELNTEGYPKNGSNAVFIPHIDRRYKIALFRNATDADNNNLNNAVWPVDNMDPVLTEGSGEVATIADLRNTEPAKDGQQISLLGHTLPGLGGGTFYFDESDTTSADNNGTIIVTAGGKRWKRPLYGRVEVSWFGATGDGLTDDTDSTQRALNIEGRIVFDSSGEYNLSTLTVGSNTIIDLNGASITQTSDVLFNITSSSKTSIIGFGNISGNSSFNRSVVAEGSLYVLIRDTSFSDYLPATSSLTHQTVISAESSSELTVTNCNFNQLNNNHICVIGSPGMSGAKKITFTENRIVNSIQELNNGLGIYNDSDVSKAEDVSITNNIFNNYAIPVHLNGVDRADVSNNIISNCQNGVVITNFDNITESSEVSVSENIIENSRDEGVRADDTNGLSVFKNTINTCEFGVSSVGIVNSKISENMIRDVTSSGTGSSNGIGINILKSSLRDCDNVTVKNNDIFNAGKIGVRIGNNIKNSNISLNCISEDFGTGSTIGIQATTVGGFVSNTKINDNTVDGLNLGIECRGLDVGTISRNIINCRGSFALKADDLDNQRFRDVYIEDNTFNSNGNEYAFRLDNSGISPVENIYFQRNNLNGNGVNSIRIQTTGFVRVSNNENENYLEGVVINSEDIDYRAREVKQAVSSSLVNMNKVTTIVSLKAGSGTINLKNAFGGSQVKFINSSGGTVTLNADSGQTVGLASSQPLADGEEAVYVFDYNVQDWVKFY